MGRTVTNKSNSEIVPMYKQSIYRMRKKQKRLEHWVLALGVLAVVFMITSALSLGTYHELDAKVDELEDNFIMLAQSSQEAEENYDAMLIYTAECEDTIVTLTDNLAIAEDQNIALYEENQELERAVTELQERQSKYDRYAYALFDTDGKRNDITYEQLQLLEQLCANSRVDQDLVLSIVMVESEGHSNCTNKKSTARGYGQFLKGTGSWVYEDLMGHAKGSYNHDMAFDGDLNLSMMVRYLEYLYSRSSSTDSVINNYRGVKDTAYKNKLNKYLSNVGKSLSTV